MVRGMEIEFSKSSISLVTKMHMDGLKIFKDRTRREHDIEMFFVGKERCSYFTNNIARSCIMGIWKDLCL